MNPRLAPVLAFLALGSSPAARAQDPGASADAPEAEIGLRVEGVPIPVADFRNWLCRMRGELMAPTYRDFWAAERAAEERDIQVADGEVESIVLAERDERIRNAFGGRRDRWETELAREGRSPEGKALERELEVRHEKLLDRLAREGRVVSEEKIVREWELAHGAGGRRYDVRLIKFALVVPPSPPGASREERAETRREAEEALLVRVYEVRQRAEAGEDFGALAREHSDDLQTRRTGGVPEGGFELKGWKPDDTEAIRALEPGQISQPLFSRGGFWLVEMRGVEETPLEEVRDEIEAELLERGPEADEIDALVSELREGAPVEVLPALFEPLEATGVPRPPEEAVLEIDGVPVDRASYGRWLLHYRGELMAPRFVQEWHARRLARDAGVSVTPEEVSARVESDLETIIEFNYQGERERWLRDVLGHGRSEEGYLRELHDRTETDLLLEKLILRDREIGDALVEATWRERYGEGGVSFGVRWIRLDVPAAEPRAGATRSELREEEAELERATLEEGRALLERLEAGEDFASLARAASDDAATSGSGGEPEELVTFADLPAEVAEELSVTAVGGISGPLLAAGEVWIVEVLEVREVPFETVRDEIRRELETRRPTEPELATFKNVIMRDLEVELLPALHE